MEAHDLLFYILLAIGLQVTAFVALALYRYRREYGEAATGESVQPIATPKQAAWPGYRQFRIERKEFENRDRSICSFYLVPVDGVALPSFKPGQFLTFRLQIGAETVVRCYSLSEAPHPHHYRISVKRIDAPTGRPDLSPGKSSHFFHEHVAEGDVLEVKAPSGHFHLAEDDLLSPLVLIGGGIGITPMLCMLQASLARAPRREVWLFYGVRNGSEHIKKAELEALTKTHPDLHLHVCYSRPEASDRPGVDFRHAGHIDIALLRQTLGLHPYHFYVCGPRSMMESLVPALAGWGVAPERIHYEAFGPSSVPDLGARRNEGDAPRQPGPAIMVTFRRSGKTQAWNPSFGSLLEFAEQTGVVVPSGCRAGSCGTCQTQVVSGEFENGKEPDFNAERGTCLLCVAKPVTDLVLAA